LELALRIVKEEKKERVIYAIPFTSIIDQSVDIFSRIFQNPVFAHHYRVDFAENLEDEINDYDRMKYLTVSWSHPFIVTTFYQLFFALFNNTNADNIKFQSLRNSVVILDEVQAIPFELWKVLQTLLPALSRKLNVTFVLMSATMPVVVTGVPELADKASLFKLNNRYRLIRLSLNADNEASARTLLIEHIVNAYERNRSVLCVVNTINNAKLLYKELSKRGIAELFCLNSYMLQSDRQAVIARLKDEGTNRVSHKVLISTQVIEAGVDLDFDVGFREMAPLSSIVQSAGRVNREGVREIADVYIFEFPGAYMIYDDVLMQKTRQVLFDEMSEIEEKALLSYIELYFSKLDGALSDRYGIMQAIERFDFDAIAQGLRKAFGTDNQDYVVSVAVGVDIKSIEEVYFDFCKTNDDPWKQKNFKEKLFKKSIMPYMLNIKRKDLDASGVRFAHSDIFGMYYTSVKEGIYSPTTGFKIAAERDEDDIFE
jgi:CRISPR-associated endonuclease/helicase Cas3